MPSRDPELYKDKIEVSLDGRQIFYLFFGGAVIVGLVFVLGVLVGRRVEARGHLDRAETQAATDPLAALDRLERSDHLSFHGALRGSEAPTDVEKAIGELEKRRAAGKPDRKPEVDRKPEPLAAPAAPPAPPVKVDARPARADAIDEPVTRPETDKARPEKRSENAGTSDKKPRKHDDATGEPRLESKPDRADGKHSEAKGDKPVSRPEAKADGKPEPRAGSEKEARSEPEAKPASEGKVRFTLQLSSFQDKGEAEAFLTATRSAGYQPYLIEADVTGKGTFYRVRLGSFRSLDAANDAKTDYEKAAKKTAQVMRL